MTGSSDQSSCLLVSLTFFALGRTRKEWMNLLSRTTLPLAPAVTARDACLWVFPEAPGSSFASM